jgi:hypothetical protein
MTKIHFRSIRMRNNAGMNFPECYTGAKLLDLDKSGLPTSGLSAEVTCVRCIRAIGKSWHATDTDRKRVLALKRGNR